MKPASVLANNDKEVMWLVVTEVQSKSLGANYRAPSRHPHPMCHHSYFCLSDILHCNARHIFHCRVWYRTLCMRHACAMHTFNTRASSSPLGYLCAKFRFCRGSRCWASPWRKILYSITQSLTHSPNLFDAPGTKAFVSENGL